MSRNFAGARGGRWLFVGGSGRIGRMLRCAWDREPPLSAVVWQRRAAKGHEPSALTDVVWDPESGPARLEHEVARGGTLTGMFVFAGVTPSPSADYAQNVSILERCVGAARAVGVKRLIVASSSAVYGAAPGGPLRESAALNPVNEYGRSKVAMEAVCDEHRADDLEIVCLRIGNVLGADALMVNARSARQDNPLRVDIFADGHGARRTYIGPATLARVLDALTRLPSWPACLNVGLVEPVTMDQLAQISGAPWVQNPKADDRLQNITLDCSQLAALMPGLLDDVGPVSMYNELTNLNLWP